MHLIEAFDDVIKRREQFKNHIALMRAKETEQERASRRKGDRKHKAASREPKKLILRKLIVERVLKSICLPKTTVS